MSGMESPVYREELSSQRTEALFIALGALFALLFASRWCAAVFDAWSIVFFCFFVFFAFYTLNYRTLVITVDSQILRLKFGLFRWTVPLANIERIFIDQTSLWRIGGAGIHFTFLGGRYRAMFNFLEYPRVVAALRVKKGPVRDIAFSTRHPDEVMRWIANGMG